MEKINITLEMLKEKRIRNIEEMKELKKNPILKRYFELQKENNSLLNAENELTKKLKLKEFCSCDHVWIITDIERDYIEGRTQKFHGCIKCGLNQAIFNKVNNVLGTEFLSFDEKIMYSYLKNNTYLRGSMVPICCDLTLAKAIYAKIKENNPDIDDKTACKYFEIALDNIREIKVSDERKENRAKRLSLTPKFNNWNK